MNTRQYADELEAEVHQFVESKLAPLLDQLEPHQLELFDKMYPDGIGVLSLKKLYWAYGQLAVTVNQNNEKKGTRTNG